jgi:transcriptional regulator
MIGTISRSKKILRLRGEGLSFEAIGKRVDLSRTQASIVYYAALGRIRPAKGSAENVQNRSTPCKSVRR